MGIESVSDVVKRSWLRWLGHVSQKDDGNWVKKSMSYERCEGERRAEDNMESGGEIKPYLIPLLFWQGSWCDTNNGLKSWLDVKDNRKSITISSPTLISNHCFVGIAENSGSVY